MTETRKDGEAGARCGIADPKRRAWCVLSAGHAGRHADSWGKRFTAAQPAPIVAECKCPPRLHCDGSYDGEHLACMTCPACLSQNPATCIGNDVREVRS